MSVFTYPLTRPRRLRAKSFLREITQEHRLHASDFIWPIFIQEGTALQTPISALPGVSRLSIDIAIAEASALHAKGLQAVALFPVTPDAVKNAEGSEALNAENLICRAIHAFKKNLPHLGIIADVALDPYTTHGHDGVLSAQGDVDNDRTMDILARQAVVLARAGADIVAPSDMMDGRVGALRMALEMEGFFNTAILAYTAKYVSALYGPFRDAVGSNSSPPLAGGIKGGEAVSKDSPLPPINGGDNKSLYLSKSTYQMNPANMEEALKEAALDVAEGADMLMVKPGLPYLDVLAALKKEFPLPVLAYHVSGEYAGVMFAAQAGAIDAKAVLLEQMLCFKRAGASAILTYAAPLLLE